MTPPPPLTVNPHQITKLITNNSSQLLCPKKKKQGKSVFVKLLVEVKTACHDRPSASAMFQNKHAVDGTLYLSDEKPTTVEQ